MCDKIQAIWDRHEAELLERVEEAEKKAEKLANEKAEVEKEQKNKILKNLLATTTLSKTEIALSVGVTLKEVEEIAKELEK